MKYQELLTISKAYFKDSKYEITLLSNASALLNQYLEDINWVGFYLNRDDQLILGPFQGKVACEIIQYNQGVCGKWFTNKQSIIVNNVHEFPGHIACDADSKSEIVIPIFVNNNIYGLLDIDSPIYNRFTQVDLESLELFVKDIEEALKTIK